MAALLENRCWLEWPKAATFLITKAVSYRSNGVTPATKYPGNGKKYQSIFFCYCSIRRTRCVCHECFDALTLRAYHNVFAFLFQLHPKRDRKASRTLLNGERSVRSLQYFIHRTARSVNERMIFNCCIWWSKLLSFGISRSLLLHLRRRLEYELRV